jgi:hypothetical protein
MPRRDVWCPSVIGRNNSASSHARCRLSFRESTSFVEAKGNIAKRCNRPPSDESNGGLSRSLQEAQPIIIRGPRSGGLRRIEHQTGNQPLKRDMQLLGLETQMVQKVVRKSHRDFGTV